MKKEVSILVLIYVISLLSKTASIYAQFVVSGPTTVCLTGTVTYQTIGASGYSCGIAKTYSWMRYPMYGQVVAGGGPNDDYITLSFTQPFANMSVICNLMCSTVSIADHSVQNIKTGDVNPPIALSKSRCGPGAVTLTATPGAGSGNLRWYQNSMGGSSIGSGTTFTTPSLTSTTTYYVSSYSDVVSCYESIRVPVTASIIAYDQPTVNHVTVCAASAVTVTGTPSPGTNSLRWYSSIVGGLPLAEALSFTTPVLNTMTPYYVSSFNTSTGCESPRKQVYIFPKILVAPTATDVERCGPGPVSLMAMPEANATTIKWYETPQGGAPLATGVGFVTPAVNINTIYYASSYDASSTCESTSRKPITIRINSIPSAPGVVAGNRRFGEGTLTLVVHEAPPTGGGYRWYNGSSHSGTGSSWTTPMVNASSNGQFEVSTTSAEGCERRKNIDVIIDPLPVIGASADRVVKQSVVVLSTPLTYDTYVWKNAIGSILGTSPTFLTSSSGRYYLTVTKNGVIGTSLPFDLKSQFQAVNANYIVTNSFLAPGVSDPLYIPLNTSIELSTELTVYFDGLGRPVQSVLTQGSPEKKDVVTPKHYDGLGREAIAYLPYVSSEQNGLLKQHPTGTDVYSGSPHYNFYNDLSKDKIIDDKRPYSETVFEPSPLDRPQKIYGAGEAWNSSSTEKFRSLHYLINKHGTAIGEEKIVAWKSNVETGELTRATMLLGQIEAGGFYSTGQLSINSIIDEQGNEIREYVDKSNRIIAKKIYVTGEKSDLSTLGNWLETDYVYDTFGDLVAVLPPEAIRVLTKSN